MSWGTTAVLAVLVAYLAAAGCGSDAASDRPASVVVEIRDPNRSIVVVRAPSTAAAGALRIELRNLGDTVHDAQLFRVDGDWTGEDIASVLEQADSAPKPRWLHPSGGVAATAPGKSAAVTQVLEPGNYWVVDTQERHDPSGARIINGAKGGIAKIEVTGDGGGTLPATTAQISATDDGLDIAGIAAGVNRVRFRNSGSEFHQAAAFPIPRKLSRRAGRRAVLKRVSDISWAPVPTLNARATTVLEAGGEQVTEMRFEPGRYLLLCFVADRERGIQQWAVGVEAELNVGTTASGPGR